MARKHKVKLMIGYMRGYDSGIELAKAIIEDLNRTGEIGPPILAHNRYFFGKWQANIGKANSTDEKGEKAEIQCSQWLPSAQRNAYLSFIGVYCHNINLMRFLLGEKAWIMPGSAVRRIS